MPSWVGGGGLACVLPRRWGSWGDLGRRGSARPALQTARKQQTKSSDGGQGRTVRLLWGLPGEEGWVGTPHSHLLGLTPASVPWGERGGCPAPPTPPSAGSARIQARWSPRPPRPHVLRTSFRGTVCSGLEPREGQPPAATSACRNLSPTLPSVFPGPVGSHGARGCRLDAPSPPWGCLLSNAHPTRAALRQTAGRSPWEDPNPQLPPVPPGPLSADVQGP